MDVIIILKTKNKEKIFQKEKQALNINTGSYKTRSFAFKILKENYFHCKILYSAKLSVNRDIQGVITYNFLCSLWEAIMNALRQDKKRKRHGIRRLNIYYRREVKGMPKLRVSATSKQELASRSGMQSFLKGAG